MSRAPGLVVIHADICAQWVFLSLRILDVLRGSPTSAQPLQVYLGIWWDQYNIYCGFFSKGCPWRLHGVGLPSVGTVTTDCMRCHGGVTGSLFISRLSVCRQDGGALFHPSYWWQCEGNTGSKMIGIVRWKTLNIGAVRWQLTELLNPEHWVPTEEIIFCLHPGRGVIDQSSRNMIDAKVKRG